MAMVWNLPSINTLSHKLSIVEINIIYIKFANEAFMMNEMIDL